MITGEWGIGKTYHYKNNLQHQISATSTLNNNLKKYKPILISLFGKNSIDEIQTDIFLSLFPILKNKSLKIAANLGKALIKGILAYNKLGEYSNSITEVENDSENLINFNDLVLCFDDLERISQKLNIEEFIGFVNNLVENEKAKVIIITNENKIIQKNFNALKEKVIGNSILFIPNLDESIVNLIENKFAGFNTYKDFLLSNKNIIYETFSKASSNLRILSFALNYFQKEFSEVSNSLQTHKLLSAKKEEILITLLHFTLTISIEYQEGRISSKTANYLNQDPYDWSNIKFDFINNENHRNNKIKNKSYRETFLDKYYQNKNFIFFESIFNFITGGSAFQIELLVNEIEKLYRIHDNKISIHSEVLNDLGNTNIYSLSDSNYKALTRKMLQFTDQGLYDITDYHVVFYFSTRFDNLMKYNLDNLEKRIIAGMKKGKINYEYKGGLDLQLTLDRTQEHGERYFRIKQEAIKINNEINNRKIKTELVELEQKCYTDFDEFYNKVFKSENQYTLVPIFKYFNHNKFYNFFTRSEGKTKLRIIAILKSRYNTSNRQYLLDDELFLTNMDKILKTKLVKISRNKLEFHILKELNTSIENSINLLSKSH